ncbi:hypothetical protein [Bacillus wiedmannii]|uniref:hypothetical protein n=1 Tax=Bacillus wiedmannii TaxID=1890302 RepID=UPI0015CF62C9|nr:hypothetical protein [Bacillus wiedmannii]
MDSRYPLGSCACEAGGRQSHRRRVHEEIAALTMGQADKKKIISRSMGLGT